MIPKLTNYMKNNSKRVFLKDIAREAGLSVAAVSMAMKGHPSLKNETVNRVKKLAEEMGYFPDPVMSALASHRSQNGKRSLSRVIALVSNHKEGIDWLSTEYGQLVHATAKQRAEKLGYKLEYFWIKDHVSEVEDFDRILQARGIQSIILANGGEFSMEMSLQWDQYYVASIGRPKDLQGVRYVAPDLNANLELAQYHLLQGGGRSLGFVSVKANNGCGFNNVPTFELDESWDPFTCMLNLRLWIEEHRIDAVIGSDSSVFDLLNDTQLFGSTVEQFASLNADPANDAIAGILPQYGFIGEAVVDLVHNRYMNNHQGLSGPTVGQKVEGFWKAGASCRDMGKASIRSAASH